MKHQILRLLLLSIALVCMPAHTQTETETNAQQEAASSEPPALTLEGLLEAVREGRRVDERADESRLQRFRREGAKQTESLAQIRQRRTELEAMSAQRETRYEENDLQIGDLEERLKQRMGSLNELFGVLQQVASDAQAQFHVSLSSLDNHDRNDFLIDFAGRMGQANRLPAIGEIETLWYEIQREMTASSQIVTFEHEVITRDGQEIEVPVTRVGLFNAVADGTYLQFIPETQRLVEFSRQPPARHLAGPKALAEGDAGIVPFAIDPVRGQLLEILTQAPNLSERVGQGGAIGYAIITLGIGGVLLALARLLILGRESRVIASQLKNMSNIRDDNAVGRIVWAARENENIDVEILELRLGEAVLKEVPRINRHLPLLKIIAAVAPLMGLLGTVTGMIVTFQAITLFGAGDPRLMAGGISQALMTTVLGLCVAIPMLLLHNIVQGRARAITEILQQRAVALVAERAEAKGRNPAQPVEANA
ncbi:MotA/TolQ/ExbB proton channel family protein [Congregibacter sp.]|nr:MotA/TolQ/ExbB proton channel family protein [Congregibacter sp.]MDA8962263.1 MotA/TolQ/ExbB proton channel family protein [Congregibacter sp.]